MPPRPRRGKWAGTRYERPLNNPKPYPGMPEKWEREYHAPILAYCEEIGITEVFHDPNSKDIAKKARGVGTGFPDWWFLGPSGLLVREFKRDSDGTVSDAQARWLTLLSQVGIDADVWWLGRDLDSGRVYNELNSIAREPRAGLPAVDLVSETAKLMYLATADPAAVPGAALHWDAGSTFINRELWRKEAWLLLHRAARALPVGDDEISAWLRAHRLPANASPAQVLAAARRTLTRHEEVPTC